MAGMYISDLEAASGVSAPTLGKWENSKTDNPDLTKVYEVSKVLEEALAEKIPGITAEIIYEDILYQLRPESLKERNGEVS